VSVEVLKASHSFTSVLAYFFLSGAVVVLGMILLARRIGRES
jgi:ABC-type antimicrobial peptide transport system permease subunit